MTSNTYSASVLTPDGEFMATYSDAGLSGLTFPPLNPRKDWSKKGPERVTNATNLEPHAPLPRQIRPWHDLLRAALANALAGREPGPLPPLDLSSGTEFQRAVWNILRGIECGRTLSYGDVAKALGRPGATRAVGGACGANPIPVLIPCHRVLAAGRKLGGFSGDLNWKRLLLAREGVL